MLLEILVVAFMSIKMQTLVYDFFIALSLFLLIMFLVIILLLEKIEVYEEYWKIKNMEKIMIDASEVWFSEGNPAYWSLDDIKQLGLANEGVVNSTKVELLCNLSYSKFYTLVKAFESNVKYQVYSIDGSLIFEYPKVEVKGRNVIFLDRYAVWNKSIVRVRTIVWN